MKDTKVGKGTGDAARKEGAKVSKSKQQLGVNQQKAKKRQTKKELKAKKDPNKPKRPPTAFFIYLEEFRKSFKERYPDVKGVTAVGKACGDKWKEMTKEEKAPYVDMAARKRVEYDRTIAAYNQKKSAGGGSGEEEATAEESEKSKSEINDDEESEEEDDDD